MIINDAEWFCQVFPFWGWFFIFLIYNYIINHTNGEINMKSKKIKSVLVLLLITLFTVNFIPSNKVQAKNSDAISAINEMVASVN